MVCRVPGRCGWLGGDLLMRLDAYTGATPTACFDVAQAFARRTLKSWLLEQEQEITEVKHKLELLKRYEQTEQGS